MAKNQKSYTPEFKQQIVDLHCKAGKGVTELSNESVRNSNVKCSRNVSTADCFAKGNSI